MDKKEELYMTAIELKNDVNKLYSETKPINKEYTEEVAEDFEILKGKGFVIFIIDGKDITVANISCLNRMQHLELAEELTKLSQKILRKI